MPRPETSRTQCGEMPHGSVPKTRKAKRARPLSLRQWINNKKVLVSQALVLGLGLRVALEELYDSPHIEGRKAPCEQEREAWTFFLHADAPEHVHPFRLLEEAAGDWGALGLEMLGCIQGFGILVKNVG